MMLFLTFDNQTDLLIFAIILWRRVAHINTLEYLKGYFGYFKENIRLVISVRGSVKLSIVLKTIFFPFNIVYFPLNSALAKHNLLLCTIIMLLLCTTKTKVRTLLSLKYILATQHESICSTMRS